MFEKMFTTKMSADKKKLQNRFSKIRSKSGKFSKIFSSIIFGVIIIIIIGAGIIMAINNSENYQMTEKEFSDYIHRPIGSITAEIDYIDEEKLIFHYIDGLFVIDLQTNEILHRINLDKLNIAGHTQGECYTQFRVDKGGNFAYLTNDGNKELVKNLDNYIINLENGKVEVGEIPDGTELFSNYSDTLSTVKSIYGFGSNRCIINNGEIYYLTVQDNIIASVQLVTANVNSDIDVKMQYVFGKNYVSTAMHKINIIKASLKSDEELMSDSSYIWEVNGEIVKRIFDKLSKTRSFNRIAPKDGNYDVRLYSVKSNEENHLMLFIIDNYKFELVLSEEITLDEHKYFVNLLNYPQMPDKEFLPSEIKNLKNAELVLKDKVYPILNSDNLKKIEQILSGAKGITGGTDCPLKGTLILTKENGEKGMVTLATDSCAVFVSQNRYYDYSDRDNSEMFDFFGINSEEIFDLT